MKKKDYSIAELFSMLEADDSWEKDPKERARLITLYKINLSIWFC